MNDLRMIGLICLASAHDNTSYAFRLTEDGHSLVAMGELFRNLARFAGVTLRRRLSSTEMLVLARALTHGGEVVTGFGNGSVSWNFAISRLLELGHLAKAGRRLGTGSVDVYRITASGAAILCGTIPFMIARMAARLLSTTTR